VLGPTEGCTIHPAGQLPRRSSHPSTSLVGRRGLREALDNGEGLFGEVAPAAIEVVIPRPQLGLKRPGFRGDSGVPRVRWSRLAGS
jgi:hypothetical protein